MTEVVTQSATDAQPTDAAGFDLNEILEDVPEPQAAAFRAIYSQLRAENEELREIVDEQGEQIDALESELAEYQDHIGREFADVRARITDTEDAVGDLKEQNTKPEGGFDGDTLRVDDGKTGSQTDETPLERICRLPEHIADRELTANQERARFIASDVRDYAEKVPAGLVIDSRAIKRVLTAAEGKRPHTQTVARVMDFLDDLGKDSVELKQRRGRKFVVVDPETADQLTHHTCCDQGTGPISPETVISG